jgi:uncharacterized protein (TIGR00645 family)
MLRRMEAIFENLLFGSRWLLAPFYLGLVLAILILLGVFVRDFCDAFMGMWSMSVEVAILKVLSLLDLALAANLILIVILAGYENFVSKIDTQGHEDRPSWMGSVGFAGLKLKLYASIVAISGIQLLKYFMSIGERVTDETSLKWLTIIHFTFVITTVLAALTDWLSARGKGSSA